MNDDGNPLGHDFGAAVGLRDAAAGPSALAGVVIGVVTKNQDPDGLGRVKVRFPWLSGDNESRWARVATPMAGQELGLYLLPEVGDEVLVAFAHGRPDLPYVLGSLWNGKARPPAGNDDGENAVRLLRTRNFEIVLDEQNKTVRVSDRDRDGDGPGRNALTLDAGARKITVACTGDVVIAAEGKLTLKGQQGVLLESGADAEVKAGANLQLAGAATAELKGTVTNVKGNPINLN